MTDEEVLRIASDVGWNIEHKASCDYLIKFARALLGKQKAWFTVEELNEWANKLPQTTHWEGCDEVHPECRKPEQEPDGISWLKRDSGYFTAPTPRKWVSLTDQEMYDLFFNDQYGPRLPEYLVNTIKCVEAALKEKNGG